MKKQTTRIIIIFAAVLAVAIAGIIALSYKNAPTANNQKLQIVAAENFWGNIASQIGGDKVEVTSIISDPGTDPHLYESNAHDAAALSRASLVITNGLGYDDFMDKLLSVSAGDNRQVLAADKILDVSGENPNPHLWYDIPQVGKVADTLEKAMAKKDPGNAAVYQKNLAAFKTSLQPIMVILQKIKTDYPGAPVAYTERVPEYLLAAAGLSVKTPAGFSGAIEEGNDPSPADTTAMDRLFTDRRVRVLLYNAQATSSVTEHARMLAKQAGIPVVGVTETLPKSEATYQSWQLHQAQALLKALENK
jgi:zinc/manganese transport system substrate-binding protein